MLARVVVVIPIYECKISSAFSFFSLLTNKASTLFDDFNDKNLYFKAKVTIRTNCMLQIEDQAMYSLTLHDGTNGVVVLQSTSRNRLVCQYMMNKDSLNNFSYGTAFVLTMSFHSAVCVHHRLKMKMMTLNPLGECCLMAWQQVR